jgi:hypothetical protein
LQRWQEVARCFAIVALPCSPGRLVDQPRVIADLGKTPGMEDADDDIQFLSLDGIKQLSLHGADRDIPEDKFRAVLLMAWITCR